jgi:polyferredoxin
MHKKFNKIQILRFIIQLVFMASLILSLDFIPATKEVNSMLLPTILLIGVFFCGWVCPFGAAQEWMAKLGRLLHLPRLRVPQSAQRYPQLTRYGLYLLLTMGVSIALLQGPRNFSLLMRGYGVTIATGIVILFLIISLFIDRPFCNYFCTGGARMGLFSVLRIFGIRRDTEQCRQCGQCTRTCPMNIDVARTDFVRHPNCISCLRCVSSCPRKLLKYGLMPGKEKKK